ncbi:MAG TPA: K(+)-transporting ATPase subunit C [Syntrophomonas sp.]|nr:K(+)-transporting ATPase subunit C [Syntrophomonas sp.]
MKLFLKTCKPAVICFAVMTVLCGVLYTAAITGIAQSVFPRQANGSIIIVTMKDGTRAKYGSALIAQEFTQPEYLIGRPTGTTNLSPTGEKQKKLLQERIDWWHRFDPNNQADIPADLLTASGSGVDPYISPAAAAYQVQRIAAARNMQADDIERIIQNYTSKRWLGFIGEPGVNILKVNLALDGLL